MRKRVTLALQNNEKKTIKTETLCGGLFAVHGTLDENMKPQRTGFTLTHVPSGMGIVHYRSKKQLVNAIPKIMDLGFPWLSATKDIERYGKRYPGKVREMYRLIDES